METTTRYLATIESLMIENSRLTKEIESVTKGILPSRIISQEIADKCFNKIASIIGPVANGTLFDEITFLCNEFVKVGQEYVTVLDTLKIHKKQQTAIEQVVKGDDVEENYIPTSLVNNVSRLRAVLEVTRTRLARFVASGSNELGDLYKELATFLDGDGAKNE
jgi:hypothetical protein